MVKNLGKNHDKRGLDKNQAAGEKTFAMCYKRLQNVHINFPHINF